MAIPEIQVDPTDGPLLKLTSPDGLTVKDISVDNDGIVLSDGEPIGAYGYGYADGSLSFISFFDLFDVAEDDFVGHSGDNVVVNGTEDGLIFAAGGVGNHNLLSSAHPDTITASPLQGDIIVSNADPKWTKLAVGSSGEYLRLSGADPAWSGLLAADLSGTVAIANGGTGASTASGARTNLDVDQAGTDNSTDVTLAGTPDYITIVGQVITRNQIDLTADVTGDLPITEGGTVSPPETSESHNVKSASKRKRS